ncbi:tripartite tricarboxylate transporter substrate binding protein [Hydrogenophaga sp.]|uniref:Bug family tripartite tricarboxylate transporter substrate binding protein n=1 Tax=Hydrogenophaga sp. TaxID=1904254 RepID=UPI0026206243|nr:tripartite tricarboxylate transporter substrate binding protein [Hydrogenophaga sp.]MCA0440784.1 tripartite tricarboxylate transporter substrate binding protein [Pseudomonadota bacterium]MCW5652492.1 tripartite tricarboxylate transporter substrate binding protein [Hydrogenophaga sp.]
MQILKNYKARLTAAALGILCAAAAPLAAHAQDFPTHPVKIVVPFPAGGTTDILARQLAKELGERWGKPVIVDNKAGASGTIFSEQLARMPPDGHTLMLTATHHVINPGLYKNLKYDTRTDFTPLAQVAAVPNVLVVHPSFPPKTVQQLVAYAKANPGKVNFGSSGTGGANHLSGELFKLMAGVEMVHVPYKGAATALTDLLGGQIPMMFDSVPGVLQHIQSGKLLALGVTSLKRSPALPNVPTIDEAGLKGFEATAWFGLYAPGRMDPKLREKLAGDVRQVLQSANIRSQFAALGAEPGSMTQAQFTSFVDAELTKWVKVISDANVKID